MMDTVNIIVMGKSGAGKSTLINTVLGELLAPTGVGQAVTKENHLYTKKILLPRKGDGFTDGQYSFVLKKFNLYDTVGIEIDPAVTRSALYGIRRAIDKIQVQDIRNEFSLVWFCVNYRSNRFEPFEIEIIQSLAAEYKIRVLLVLTQCYADTQGEFERHARLELPEIPIVHVLAKELRLRNDVIRAHGITELLQMSVWSVKETK